MVMGQYPYGGTNLDAEDTFTDIKEKFNPIELVKLLENSAILSIHMSTFHLVHGTQWTS